jgi:hypothetical protein
MGFDIAMERQSWSHVGFIFFSIVSFHWIKPPKPLFYTLYEICLHSVVSLISYLSMTCRSSYYLQGTWPTEIFPPLFGLVWLLVIIAEILKTLFIFSVFMLRSYIKMLVSHLHSFWRAANVFSCAYILNLARPPHCQIPRQYQQALWYSGMSAIEYVLF